MDSLKYVDEKDKSYGLAGMSIAAVVWDEADAIASINLDANDGESVKFASDYVYSAPSGVSVKSVWEHSFIHYRLCARLMMANVACRHLVHRHKDIPSNIVKTMRDMVCDEGNRQCSLETDESETVFNKNYENIRKIFGHSAVQQVARDFAENLLKCREMTGTEIMESLHRLQML